MIKTDTESDPNSDPKSDLKPDLETDFETISAADFGRSLKGMGLNLLARDVVSLQRFLSDVFGMQAYRVSADFAIMQYQSQVFQLHSDPTFSNNPLLSLLPENNARGAGIEIRLYQTDPDEAIKRAQAHSHETTVLQAPANKPHGLRECIILCENGYAWVPSRPLESNEQV